MSSLNQVHDKGILWCDCRPENIGICNGRPLLIDWNLASRIGDLTNPHEGTRCFASQRLLYATEARVTRVREDDIESLMKSLIEIFSGRIHRKVHDLENPQDRADMWARNYDYWSKDADIREELANFIRSLPAF